MDSSERPQPPRRTGDAVPMRAVSDPTLPPHPLDKRWHVHVDGQTYGPYTGHEIRRMIAEKQIHEADFVCAEGASAWSAANADPLLGSMFRAGVSTLAQVHAPAPINAGGGTVVQVTNQVPNNNAAVAALLMSAGDAAPKSPGIALLLSFLFCGAGQMYNGQVGKGIALLIFYWITLFLGFSLAIIGIGLLFFLVAFILWIWSLADAYSVAKQMNLRFQQRMLAGLA